MHLFLIFANSLSATLHINRSSSFMNLVAMPLKMASYVTFWCFHCILASPLIIASLNISLSSWLSLSIMYLDDLLKYIIMPMSFTLILGLVSEGSFFSVAFIFSFVLSLLLCVPLAEWFPQSPPYPPCPTRT